MQVAVTASGGEFSQSWRVYADGWLTLPGDATHWPEDVRVDGSPAALTAHDGVPRLRVAAGAHTVTGRFVWSRRPEALRVPVATALVDLRVDGREIAPVEIRNDRLWLGAVRTVTVPRALQLDVYRLLQDDIPLHLITRLQLRVSGDAREELLAPALPEGFEPMAAGGPLPMRFEPDGSLRVQVRSGEHVLTILARDSAAAGSMTVPSAPGAWANEEVWSYRGNDRLRITAIENAQPIYPVAMATRCSCPPLSSRGIA